jgi:hypothetical protein
MIMGYRSFVFFEQCHLDSIEYIVFDFFFSDVERRKLIYRNKREHTVSSGNDVESSVFIYVNAFKENK